MLNLTKLIISYFTYLHNLQDSLKITITFQIHSKYKKARERKKTWNVPQIILK